MQYSDRPISDPKLDLLGRAPFALDLAHAIDQLALAKDGFVLAVEGEWGSGKTSVVELVLRYLRHIEMERASQRPVADEVVAVPQTIEELDRMCAVYQKIAPRIEALENCGANLSYWQRGARTQDFQRWLDGNEDEAAQADRYWKLKLCVSEQPRTIVVRFSPWLIAGRSELASALFSDLSRALGDRLGQDVKEAFGKLLVRLAELAPVAGSAVEAAGAIGFSRVVSAGGGWIQRFAGSLSPDETLDGLRRKLQGALRQLEEQRVLVVVDDLDRLTPTEALHMVSIVKSLGDLPNVIYILSYDAEKLAKSLKRKLKTSGREFLEKIVQYQVDLPPIEEDELFELLASDLRTLARVFTAQDQRRLQTAWTYSLRHYLRTPRHVRRVVNSLAVAFKRDLDPVETLLLEAVKLNDPSVYRWIKNHIGELTE